MAISAGLMDMAMRLGRAGCSFEKEMREVEPTKTPDGSLWARYEPTGEAWIETPDGQRFGYRTGNEEQLAEALHGAAVAMRIVRHG